MSDAKAWIRDLRRAHVYLDEGEPFFSGKDCAELADLIEQQAARIAELEARAGEAVAYVPVHPRNGPLWANTVPSMSNDRPQHYPVRTLFFHPPTGDAAGKDSVDAARYRWLRRQAVAVKRYASGNPNWEIDWVLRGESFEGAIDAAIASLTKTADGEKQ
jgi:hypothetical protein